MGVTQGEFGALVEELVATLDIKVKGELLGALGPQDRRIAEHRDRHRAARDVQACPGDAGDFAQDEEKKEDVSRFARPVSAGRTSAPGCGSKVAECNLLVIAAVNRRV